MRHGSLFSGIGGFDLAASWMGWENVFQCEKDAFCRRVLRYYWPKAVCYEDVRKFDATIYRGLIDVLTGGFPCQPFSIAGKRKGTDDDRFLWPEMCRIIGEIRPRWIVGENVLGLLNWRRGLVFEQVLADLEAKGYEAWPYILPASGVGAPHRRDRVWVIAHTRGDRRGEYPTAPQFDEEGIQKRLEKGHDVDSLDGHGDVADAYGVIGRERWLHAAKQEAAERHTGLCGTWDFRDAWQNFPSQSPVCDGDDGLPGRLDRIALGKWRTESIKAGGNAIVPQVAFQIFKVIERIDKMVV